MTTKADIVKRLGEGAVLLPSLIGDALAANDRIKLALSALQEAVARAQGPGSGAAPPRPILSFEQPDLMRLIAGACAAGNKKVFLPGLNRVFATLQADLGTLLVPLRAANPDDYAELLRRAERVQAEFPHDVPADEIDASVIGDLARADSGRDSFHRLVMDIHQALNRLLNATAVETLDGARVHALDERDRAAVRAFMAGLHRTAALAFGHPGLGTTAVRANGKLTLQNDIGVTDAHVLVVHVAAETVSIIYTDIHRARAKFFMSLFEEKGVTWSSLAEQRAEGIAEDDLFYLINGTYRAVEPAAIDSFLTFLGSRIVFLIDWNKARKALQTFVGRRNSIELLHWSACHDYGHRAFLVLGGADLIFEVIHRVAAGRIAYGMRLDEAIGAGECQDFLRRALQNSSEGLSAGRTARLIRDEIQADLSRRFQSAEASVLRVLVRHLGLTRDLAGMIADRFVGGNGSEVDGGNLALRAKQLESKGDRLTVTAREVAARIREGGVLRRVIDEIENATDTLEDCAFFLSLVPRNEQALASLTPLTALSEITLEGVSQIVRAIEATSRLPAGHRADAVAALQAIDAVAVAERDADAAERDGIAALVARPLEARAFVLGLEIVRKLEAVTDHLAHSALSLRERVMEELSA